MYFHCPLFAAVFPMNDILAVWTSLTRKEELAAVIVPWGLMNAAFSLLICSMVDGLIPLSLTTVSATPVNNKGRTSTGLIKISYYLQEFLVRQFKAFLYISLIDNTTLYQQPDKHIYLELCMVGHQTVVLSQKPSGPWNGTSRHTHPVIQNRKSIIQVHVRN